MLTPLKTCPATLGVTLSGDVKVLYKSSDDCASLKAILFATPYGLLNSAGGTTVAALSLL